MVRVRIKTNNFFTSKEDKIYFAKENWSTHLVKEAYKFGLAKYPSTLEGGESSTNTDVTTISLDSDLSRFPTLTRSVSRKEPELKVNFVCRYRKKNHFFVYKLKSFAEEEELSKWIKYRLEKANKEANIEPASNSYIKVFSLKVAKEVIRKVKNKFNSSVLELCNDLNLLSLHEYVMVNVSRRLIEVYKEYPLIIYLFLASYSISTSKFLANYSFLASYSISTSKLANYSNSTSRLPQSLLWASIKVESHYPFLIRMINLVSSNIFSDVKAIVEELRFKRINLKEVKEISKETAYYIYRKAKLSQKIKAEVIDEFLVLGLKMNSRVFISLAEHLYCKASDINSFIFQGSSRRDSLIDCRVIVCSLLEMYSLASIKEDEIELAIKVIDLLLEILKSLNYQGLLMSKLNSNSNKVFILKSLIDFKANSTKLIGKDNTDILIEMLKNE